MIFSLENMTVRRHLLRDFEKFLKTLQGPKIIRHTIYFHNQSSQLRLGNAVDGLEEYPAYIDLDLYTTLPVLLPDQIVQLPTNFQIKLFNFKLPHH